MTPASLPANEVARLEALRQFNVLDTAPEAEYDDLTKLAAYVCGTPISLVSLLDERRQWFKSKVGLTVTETPRELAFCTHAIFRRDTFVVPDAREDARFAANPLVTGDPLIRFYAGAPLVESGGNALGTLCVIDREPRTLAPAQIDALEMLARQVVRLFELRRTAAALADALGRVRALGELVPVCAWCKNVRNDAGFWGNVEEYIRRESGRPTTHGICPDCLAEQVGGA